MSTPLSEKVLNDLEAVLNDAYPKTSYEGDFITAENTVEGLTGTVVADEETDIVVCNKNLMDLNYSQQWNNTIMNVSGNRITFNKSNSGGLSPNMSLLKNIKLKAGTTLTLTGKYISGIRNDDGKYYWDLGVCFIYADDVEGSIENITIKYYADEDSLDVKTATITLTEDIEGIGFYNYIPSSSPTTDGDVIFDMQLEIGNTSTDFVEHQEQNYTGTSIDIKTYDDITHIYNTSNVNMTAEVRERRN